MKIISRLLLGSALLLAAPLAHATSVLPPTFAELVTEADTIVRGTVTDVRSVSVETSRGPAIHTLVTLQVEQALKGTPGETVTLTVLGGKVGRRTLTVDGLPQFRVGERTIVFYANNGRTICPVIGARHGRFNLQADAAGGEIVLRDNGRPLTSVEDVPLPFVNNAVTLARTSSASTALSRGAFEAAISSALQAQRTPVARPN